jgi:hypothetical protein
VEAFARLDAIGVDVGRQGVGTDSKERRTRRVTTISGIESAQNTIVNASSLRVSMEPMK